MKAAYRVQVMRQWFGLPYRSKPYLAYADNMDDLAAQIRHRYLKRRWWLIDVRVLLNPDGNGQIIADATDGNPGSLVAVVFTERVPS